MRRTTLRSALRLLLIGVIAIGLVFSNSPTAMAIGFAGDERIGENYVFPEWQNPPEIEIVDGDVITFTVDYINRQIEGYTRSSIPDAPDYLHVRGYEVRDAAGEPVVPENHNIVGPTIRVSPGEHFSIDVVNNLPDCVNIAGGATDNNGTTCESGNIDPQQFNVTNLHTHGLHVLPAQDNVLLEITPNGFTSSSPSHDGIERHEYSYTYRYDIPKAGQTGFFNGITPGQDHPQGTFWYHPHVHQSTALQTSSGMSGALIVEGGLDDVYGIQGAEEKIFVFQQIPFVIRTDDHGQKFGDVEDFDNTFGPGTWDDVPPGSPSHVWSSESGPQKGGRTTINGQLVPQITMSIGELQRWRFIHAGVRDSLNLIICKVGEPLGCSFDSKTDEGTIVINPELEEVFQEIANDGIAFNEIKKKPMIILHPGYRSDVLVGIDTPGVYALIDDRLAADGILPNNPDRTRAVLARIVVDDSFGRPPITPDLDGLAPFEDIETLTGPGQEVQFTVACIDGHGNILAGAGPNIPDPIPGDPDNKRGCGAQDYNNQDHSDESTQFLINGNSFNYIEGNDPVEIQPEPRDLTLNDVEQWELTSLYNPHVFHIHINSFQIVGGPDDGVWKDTIYIPSYDPDAETPEQPKIVTIRTRYEDFAGNFVIHCHILDHEDEGMMQIVRICPTTGCPDTELATLHH